MTQRERLWRPHPIVSVRKQEEWLCLLLLFERTLPRFQPIFLSVNETCICGSLNGKITTFVASLAPFLFSFLFFLSCFWHWSSSRHILERAAKNAHLLCVYIYVLCVCVGGTGHMKRGWSYFSQVSGLVRSASTISTGCAASGTSSRMGFSFSSSSVLRTLTRTFCPSCCSCWMMCEAM